MTLTPKPIQPLLILAVDERAHRIRFLAVEDTLAEIRARDYGRVRYDDESGEYELAVSPLYPFQAVVEWLEDQAQAA